MDKKVFESHKSSIAKNNHLFRRVIMLLTLTILVLVISLMMCINREKIILVPQVSSETKMWVSSTEVSNEYLTMLSRNIIDLMFNLTPDNVVAQHKEVLRFVSSQNTKVMTNKLAAIEELITKSNISQNFFIKEIRIINKKHIVYVSGELKEYIDTTLSSNVTQIYKLDFKVSDFGALLDDFALIKPDDPQLKGIF